MIKSCKIRIYPNKTQEKIIHNTLSGCRYIHNLYLECNIQRYKECGKFLSGYDFSKMVTQLKKKEDQYHWLKDVSSKALKDAIMNAEKSFKRFFHKNGGFPHFKSKKRRPVNSYFFIKDNIHYTNDKNIIKLPLLGRIRITENEYLPHRSSITSGRIVYSHGKYYAVFLYEIECKEKEIISCGLGLDLGIKEYATVYDGKNSFVFHSYLKDKKYLYLTKRIENLQQVLSKKVEINYTRKYQEYFLKHDKEPNEITKNIMKGESYNHTSIRKIRKKISKLYEKRDNYTNNKILSYINILVRAKPEYITIEDLNISKLLQNDGNKKLHRHIQDSKWYYFITRLVEKCKEYQIEIRKAYKFYASSKTCSMCGYKKKDLSLSDRVFICPECGYTIDRDINASINLKYTKKYIIC